MVDDRGRRPPGCDALVAGRRGPARLLDLRDDGVGVLRGQIVDHHGGAPPRELERLGAADAAPGARHDRHPSVEAHRTHAGSGESSGTNFTCMCLTTWAYIAPVNSASTTSSSF